VTSTISIAYRRSSTTARVTSSRFVDSPIFIQYIGTSIKVIEELIYVRKTK